MLITYLKTLSSLRDSYKFSYNSELEYAVGAAVRTMGPETILQVIPLTVSFKDFKKYSFAREVNYKNRSFKRSLQMSVIKLKNFTYKQNFFVA